MSFGNWRDLTQERIKEILKIYEVDKKRDLFNWCEEYKSFISDCVNGCFTMEVEYILKKSYQDSEAPLSYEDLDLFDKDKAIELIMYILENDKDEDEIKELLEETNKENNLRGKTIGDYEVYLKNLDNSTLEELCRDKFNLYEDQTNAEVYEWWFISDPLKYRLEKQGEIFLNEFWGRQTTGQHISLDNCCIKAFIDLIKDRLN